MIPLRLVLSGFLSYNDPVEIDFTPFELACISGANGAGKSSLLDAITWVLFGEARRRDDALIHAGCKEASVSLEFSYEGNTYRVLRARLRDKSALLEFQFLQSENQWKPLTERTLRETQAKIESVLRLNYETFVNASFFLQGKADQFTQQRPGDRKRILGSILGLDIWEEYRKRAADQRKSLEEEIDRLDGRLHEIALELDEEDARRGNLSRLEGELDRLSRERAVQESLLENIRRVAAVLAAQRNLVETLRRQASSSQANLERLTQQLKASQQESSALVEIIGQAETIESGYACLLKLRQELERWDEIAARFREQERLRAEPLMEIEASRSRLEGEQSTLQSQEKAVLAARARIPELEGQIEAITTEIQFTEERIALRDQYRLDLDERRKGHINAQVENRALKAEMDELSERIGRLKQVDGAVCPFCGQPLNQADRLALIASLEARGKEMGDRFRANKNFVSETETALNEIEQAISRLRSAEADQRARTAQLAQVTSQLEAIHTQLENWEKLGAKRLGDIRLTLQEESYAPQARLLLTQVDAQLKEIGYDAREHDQVRKAEMAARVFDSQVRQLEQARAALNPTDRQIAELQSQIGLQQADSQRQMEEYQSAAQALAADEAQAPDLQSAESMLFHLQENENHLRLELGAARQKVLVLDDLKQRRKVLQAQRAESARQAGYFRQLERAFSKDGIPALLIEQALPEIEMRANEILDRLSGSLMTVRFITQSAYKDKKRDDLRETLDIQISDGAGTRDYELYSGGEAFRVNFAIRLALSEVLARRAGARLQTLVIDEGFGSQDAQGRQRLIEAINLVRPDFAKILVITHIEELKDAFPARIEINKTERGSTAEVVLFN
jgi:exonuclease SbcC